MSGDELNPYQAPRASISRRDDEPAERIERLAAVLIDGVLNLIVVAPVAWIGGYWQRVTDSARAGEQLPILYVTMWAAIGFVIFIAMQGVPLSRTGQTWGKRVMRIRIAAMDGSVPPLGRLLALRYAPVNFVGVIPVVGALAVLVDSMMVFRHDRRCAHDLIAGTRVVRAG